MERLASLSLYEKWHEHPCQSCGEPVACDGPRCGSIYLPDVELTCEGCVGEEEGEVPS